jgi:hypothetical protein
MSVVLRLLACAVLFCIAGCAENGGMAFAGAARPSDIHYYYNNLFSTYAVGVDITSEGDVSIIEQRGSGPQNIRQVNARLNAEQRASLLNAFRGWKQLKQNYPGDWNVTAEITYDGYKVTALNAMDLPKTFTNAQAAINRIARASLPPWPVPASQPATAPSTAPATSPSSTGPG